MLTRKWFSRFALVCFTFDAHAYDIWMVMCGMYVHICVCECLCMCACVCTCMSVCLCVCLHASICSVARHLIFWNRVSHWSKSICLCCLATQLQGISSFHLPSAGITDVCHYAQFYMGARDLNTSPYVYIARKHFTNWAIFPSFSALKKIPSVFKAITPC